MITRLELQIALRYLRSHRTSRLLSQQMPFAGDSLWRSRASFAVSSACSAEQTQETIA